MESITNKIREIRFRDDTNKIWCTTKEGTRIQLDKSLMGKSELMKNIIEGDKECNVIQLKHLSNDEMLLIKYFNEKKKIFKIKLN